MKISDKIERLLALDTQDPKTPKAWYSYEYFPPKTPAGEENLVDRIARMATTNPLWVDVTWGAGGSTYDTTLDLCGHIVQNMGLDVLMHITCTGMTRDKVIQALDKAKEYGIRNILALRGDPPAGHETWTPVENGFHYATQLVQFIKERYGDFFCVVVAGYPETHMQAVSRDDDIKHLKEKVDAGADVIITQLFYNNQMYFEWVRDCKAQGINAHFVPGLMPIMGYDRFQRTVKFCKTNVPEGLAGRLEAVKADDEKVREFGIQFGVEQCQELIDGGCRFLHFYTMNLETACVKVIKGLGVFNQSRALPFPAFGHGSEERQKEDVRPIFWATKPQSYRQRTQQWDEYPNGRWGVSRSPAFGSDDTGFVSYSKKFKEINIEEKKKFWGATCTSLSDVSKVFCAYLKGEIKKFPFSEGALHSETGDINQHLLKMNENKLLTINSQPKCNGAKSSDPKFGWGPEKGYVYQKAYVEFFVHKSLIGKLVEFLNPLENLTYQAISSNGQEQFKNVSDTDVNAVTWGVFKSKEIVQPTVVDHQAFEIWKDEAFKAWTETWAVIYKAKGEQAAEEDSLKFLDSCKSDLFLVNIVDNDYIEGDLYANILDFIDKNQDSINAI